MTDGIKISLPEAGAEDEIEQFQAHDNPMLEAPLLTRNPHDLYVRVQAVVDDLRWRQNVRERQEYVYEILRDLNTTKKQRAEAVQAALPQIEPPKTSAEARAIVGEVLAKCYGTFQVLISSGTPQSAGPAARLGGVIVRLADTMQRLNPTAPDKAPAEHS